MLGENGEAKKATLNAYTIKFGRKQRRTVPGEAQPIVEIFQGASLGDHRRNIYEMTSSDDSVKINADKINIRQNNKYSYLKSVK